MIRAAILSAMFAGAFVFAAPQDADAAVRVRLGGPGRAVVRPVYRNNYAPAYYGRGYNRGYNRGYYNNGYYGNGYYGNGYNNGYYGRGYRSGFGISTPGFGVFIR
jgi:hypothetical protein